MPADAGSGSLPDCTSGDYTEVNSLNIFPGEVVTFVVCSRTRFEPGTFQ